MPFIKNLSLKIKLQLLTLPLLLVMIFLAVLQLTQLNQTTQNMTMIDQLARLSHFNSILVHELQKERGATAGYLASSGSNFGSLLDSQHQQTNEAIKSRNAYVNELRKNLDNPEINDILQAIDQSSAQLKTIRDNVNNLAIDTDKALGYYTDLNGKLLQVAILVTKYNNNAEINREILAYAYFLQAKERAGIERALLNKIFTQNTATPGDYKKFITLVTEQSSYFNSFNELATSANRQFFTKKLQAPSIAAVEEYRNNVINNITNVDGFNITPSEWFDAATEKINTLKQVENHLSDTLLTAANQKRDNANSLLVLFLISIASIIAISVLLSRVIQSNLNRQISSLVDTIDTAQTKNDLSVRAQVISKDEIGNVAGKFNEMLTGFSEVINDIGASSEQLASAVEETAATVEESNQNLTIQQNETTQLAAAIHEMSVTAQEVANNTQQAADAAQEAHHETSEGYQLVTAAVEEVQGLSKEVENVSHIFSVLNESSASITGVLDVIKSVAEQTNLLALNAAIEAARAGEQGRGFAVVADEVRSLAQRTQESTGEIESLLTSFQNDAAKAQTVVTASQEKAQTTSEKASGIKTMLDKISQAITTINDMNYQIAGASEEQVAVNEEVNRNVVRINEMSESTAAGSAQISEAAQEQAELANKLQNLSARFII